VNRTHRVDGKNHEVVQSRAAQIEGIPPRRRVAIYAILHNRPSLSLHEDYRLHRLTPASRIFRVARHAQHRRRYTM
jgi:hypothetical protein